MNIRPKLLLPLLLLAGCAGSPRPFGDARLPPPLAAGTTFTVEGEGPAVAAVRQALVNAGHAEKRDGDWRVEVGFAIRPTNLAVSTPQSESPATPISPGTRPSLAFCKKQAYVLTLAFVDSRTGKVASRRGATTGRCSGDVDTILPGLARTALGFRKEAVPAR